MADLIIKPSVGNLILKDDQNVTRVSIAPTTGITTLSNQVFPAGHVLQCKVASKTSKSTTANTTPTSTGLTLSITPSDATNKIFVQAVVGSVGHSGSLNRTFISISGGTSQSVGDSATGYEAGACWCPRSADASWAQGSLACSFLDAPASTSAQTYTLNFWTTTGTSAINSAYSNSAEVGNTITTLTAWEVVQ